MKDSIELREVDHTEKVNSFMRWLSSFVLTIALAIFLGKLGSYYNLFWLTALAWIVATSVPAVWVIRKTWNY